MAPTGLYHQVSKYFKNTSMYPCLGRRFISLAVPWNLAGRLSLTTFLEEDALPPLSVAFAALLSVSLVILLRSVLANQCMTSSSLQIEKSFLALIEPWASRAATALLPLFFGIMF